MGRIKTTLVKRVSRDLIEKYGPQLKRTFDENKVLIDGFAEIRSKKLRNTIAGHVTHLKRMKD